MPPSIAIPKPENFSFAECLWYLDRNFDDCMHQVKDAAVVKLFHFGQEPILLKIYEAGDELRVDVLAGETQAVSEEAVVQQVSEWFDLDRDLSPFRKLAAADPELALLVEKYWGLRLISIPNLFEALCWSIIGQQINLSFAYKLKRRMVEATAKPFGYENGNYYLFPTPEQIVGLSVDELKQMQFSSQKARYILSLSQAFARDEISREQLIKLPDTAAVISHLTHLTGIGEWTANYVAMKCLRRMDAITYTDAGLLNGYKKLKNLQVKPQRPELESFFSQFPSWQAYVVFYIWRSLS